MAHPPQLHGPSFQWSYKIAGKTRTIRLFEQQAALCQEWIRNHKRLKRLLRQMEQLSLRPDFLYGDHQTAIYVDGPPHDDWTAIVRRYPSVFGKLV